MKIALCNEVIREMEFSAQCAFAASVGYDGLEVAPFTLGDEPHVMPASMRQHLRRAAQDAGIAVSGLHWLLVVPPGLSLTSADTAVRAKTVDVMRRLVGLCADLGGQVLVHGSPAQRQIHDEADRDAAWSRARDALAIVAADATAAGVTYCIEPLAPRETNFINSLAEAAKMVDAVGSPGLRTMVDAAAASLAEATPVADLLDHWLPKGVIAHVQVNDRNRRGPGQGNDLFAPLFAVLRRHDYGDWVAVEPFDYFPDGPAAAARAIGYIRGVLEALAWQR